MRETRSDAAQRGVVLVVSLLVLLVLGIVATTVARTNQLQLHMAGNDEARIAALQQALAVSDSVLGAATGAQLPATVGYRVCTAAAAADNCDERTLVLDPLVEPGVGKLEVALVRMAPLVGRLPVMGEADASSTVHYRAAKIEIQVGYDGIREGSGRAALAQGLLVRLPAPLQTEGGLP
jgi:hypothetical protein